MKLINNKIIKNLLSFVLIIVISLLVELFGFNFNLITLGENKATKIDYEEDVLGEYGLIKIDLDSVYVNKLRIEYQALDDVAYTIKYIEKDYYGEVRISEVNDIFDDEVVESITNIKNEVGTIEISYDIDSDIEIENIIIDNEVSLSYFRVIFISLVIIACIILIKYYKNGGLDSKLHKYFVILGIILGGAMIILNPTATYYSWDDQIHFSNVYELKGGNVDWSVGEYQMIENEAIGRDSIDSLEEQINQKQYLNSDGETDYSTYAGRFITYNKIVYIPSAIGYHGGKLLGLPFDICFMLGKFMNLVSYLLIIGYAIKITKVGKKMLVVLGLIPTSLFLACQYSYDSAVISGLILAMVCLINWFVDKTGKVDFKNLVIFILSMLYSCFPKAVYIPLILLFLFIPTDRFRNKKQSILIKCGMGVIFVLMMATFVLPAVSGSALGDNRGGDTSVTEQLQIIVNNPIGYVKVLNDTMIKNFISSFIGIGALGSYAYIGNISNNLYMIFLILILFVAFTDNSKTKLKTRDRILFLCAILVVVLLIWTALYLSFTPVGYNTINGVQPRYFLPMLFPLLFWCNLGSVQFKGSSKIYNLIILLVSVVINFTSIYQLILINYCL